MTKPTDCAGQDDVQTAKKFLFYVVRTSKENQQTLHDDTTVVAGFDSAVDARRFALQSIDSKFFTSVCDSNFNEIWRFS